MMPLHISRRRNSGKSTRPPQIETFDDVEDSTDERSRADMEWAEIEDFDHTEKSIATSSDDETNLYNYVQGVFDEASPHHSILISHETRLVETSRNDVANLEPMSSSQLCNQMPSFDVTAAFDAYNTHIALHPTAQHEPYFSHALAASRPHRKISLRPQ
jgi:hypothetical protein